MRSRAELSHILNSPKYKMVFDESKFKTPDNHTFEHKGKEYTAIFEGVVDEDHKGYVETKMTLVEGDNPVGYIKAFYMPTESIEKLYPDYLHWGNNLKGMSLGLSRHPRDLDYDESNVWEDMEYDEKLKVIKNAYRYMAYGEYSNIEDRVKQGETIDIDKEYDRLNKMMNRKYGDAFKCFKEESNQAIVEFSRLYKGDDIPQTSGDALKKYCDSRNITLDEFRENIGTNYQGQGLAVKMYKLMADYLGSNNLVLRKGMTNDESEPVWEYKIKNNPDFGYKEFDYIEVADNRNHDFSYLYKSDKLENELDLDKFLDHKIEELDELFAVKKEEQAIEKPKKKTSKKLKN